MQAQERGLFGLSFMSFPGSQGQLRGSQVADVVGIVCGEEGDMVGAWGVGDGDCVGVCSTPERKGQKLMGPWQSVTVPHDDNLVFISASEEVTTKSTYIIKPFFSCSLNISETTII